MTPPKKPEDIQIPFNPAVLQQRNMELVTENEKMRMVSATVTQELLGARARIQELEKELRAVKRSRRTTPKGTKK